MKKEPKGFSFVPVHPGRTLASELEARGVTANALALRIRVPANRVTGIIRGERGITAETALRLGVFFGTGAQFWANLQAQYDLAVVEAELGETIRKDVMALPWLSPQPLGKRAVPEP
jgi:addiction module HigA family antidote